MRIIAFAIILIFSSLSFAETERVCGFDNPDYQKFNRLQRGDILHFKFDRNARVSSQKVDVLSNNLKLNAVLVDSHKESVTLPPKKIVALTVIEILPRQEGEDYRLQGRNGEIFILSSQYGGAISTVSLLTLRKGSGGDWLDIERDGRFLATFPGRNPHPVYNFMPNPTLCHEVPVTEAGV